MLRSDLGVVAAFADIGGWDHHVNEGGVERQLADRLRELGGGLAAFWEDLGDRTEDVVVVTLTEFGRTARENGDRGTDHGQGGAILLRGGPVRGGRVHGRWPWAVEGEVYFPPVRADGREARPRLTTPSDTDRP